MKKMLNLFIVFILSLTLFACKGKDDIIDPNTEFTIVYSTDGGTSISPQMIKYSEFGDFKLPENPTKNGYVFDGWYIDALCNKAFEGLGDEIPTTLVLYAKWKDISEIEDPSTLPAPKYLKMEMPSTNTTGKARRNAPSGVEYDYKVNIDNSISIVITLESNNYDSVVDVVMKDSEYGDNCIYLTSSTQFKIVRQDIVYSTEYQSFVSEVEILAPASKVAGKRTITIQKIELLRQLVSSIALEAEIADDKDIDLDFMVNDQFKIEFVVDGRVDSKNTKTLTYEDAINIDYNPEKEGYTFINWYLDADYSKKFDIKNMPNEDIQLYAKFSIDSMTIKFLDQNGHATLKFVDWGHDLTDIPNLVFGKNEYYIWNENVFTNVTYDMTVSAIKVASMELTRDEYCNITVDTYINDNVVNAEPVYEIYIGDKKIDKEINGNVFAKVTSNSTYTVKCIIGDVTIEEEIYVPKSAPIVSISATTITTNSVEFDVNVTDEDLSLVGSSISKVSYYEGSLQNKVLTFTDNTRRSISQLKSNTLYIIEVEYFYDNNDGVGTRKASQTLEFYTVKLTPSFDVNNYTADQENIYFNIDVIDADKAGYISSIELIKNGVVKETLTDTSVRKFEKLFSNNDYTVKATYKYDLNNGEGEKEFVKTFDIKTLEKATPVLEVIRVQAEQEKVSFGLSYTDVDNVGKINKVELVKNNEVVKTITNLYDTLFEGLLSNNEYTIKVSATYDLNDGVGSQDLVTTYEFKTLEKATPTLEISNVEASQEKISYELNYNDVDKVGKINKVELIKNNEVVNTVTVLTDTLFEGLLSNNQYTIKVSATYDLNDGVGSQDLVVTCDAKTLAKEVPTLTIEDVETTFESVSFNTKIVDIDNVGSIKSIEVYLGEEKVKSLEDLTLRNIDGLLSNNNYSLKIIYKYNLNDGVGDLEFTSTANFKTVERKTPSVGLKIDRVYKDEELVQETRYEEITQTSNKFVLDLVDEDNTNLQLTSCKYVCTLFDGKIEKEVSVEGNLATYELTELYSNTSYMVTFTYTYDLKDGTEVKNGTYVYDFKTLAKAEPDVELYVVNVSDGVVTFDVKVVKDVDELYKTKSIVLTDQNNVETVISLEDLTLREFSIPTVGTKYTITLTYNYDLNIGYVNEKSYSVNFNYYTVSFNSNGGSEVASLNSFEYEHLKQLPTTTKEGFVFAGWYTDDTYTLRVSNPTKNTQILENKTYIARWYEPADIFTFTEGETEVTITGVQSEHMEDVELIIPATINGKAVTTISSLMANGQEANAKCNYIYIGKNVTNIPNGAFSQFTGLTSVEFEEGSKCVSIGDNAFKQCASLKNVYLPEGLVSIGANAFSLCTGLVEITIPASVTTIGDGLFDGCTRLKNITFLSSNPIGYGIDLVPIKYMLTNIYVPAEAVDTYKNQYGSLARYIVAID